MPLDRETDVADEFFKPVLAGIVGGATYHAASNAEPVAAAVHATIAAVIGVLVFLGIAILERKL